MAASAAIIGKGTTLGYAAFPTPAGYTNFAELTKIGFPKTSFAEVKVTHYLSPNTLHEYISGWGDSNEVSVEGNYIKADMTTLQGLQGVLKTFKITLPDASTVVFGGFIKEVEAELPNESQLQTKFTIKVTGLPTFT